MDTSSKGAWGELLACADLIWRGFEVYRAVSPSAACDLVVVAPSGQMLKIEVKCALYTQSSWRIAMTRKPDSCDHVAAVMPDGGVHYMPALPGCRATARMTNKLNFVVR